MQCNLVMLWLKLTLGTRFRRKLIFFRHMDNFLQPLHSHEKISGRFADFLYNTAFLKSKFEDDPVRVQRHNVPHFKGLINLYMD